MQEARAKVKAACEKNGVFFLNSARPDTVTAMIDEGVRVVAGGKEAAEIGRKHTGRKMAW